MSAIQPQHSPRPARQDFPTLRTSRSAPPAEISGEPAVIACETEARGRRLRALVREWLPVVLRLALKKELAHAAADRALAHRTGFVAELLASGHVDERSLFRAIADELGLPFISDVDPSLLLMRERHRLAALAGDFPLLLARLEQPGGETAYVLADPGIGIAAMRRRLALQPRLARHLRIAAPGALRAAMLARTRPRLMFDACFALLVRRPEFSARSVADARQGVCVGLLLAALPLGLVAMPAGTLLTLLVVATATFFSCIALRLLATGEARPPKLRCLCAPDPGEQPVYSVLVALYREREIVPELLAALGRIEWPRSKLEIKLVCEADDHETLSALRDSGLRPWVEIVEVPPGEPRTKPKALAYALPLCTGEFVTLFDAEDRPHPRQLVEAWQRFRAEDETLACLQAPLVVTNARAGRLQLMFAFEYAGLFRGLLPWLARRGLVFPLGGTSNHFRRAALVEAGGWDPHNVTEDADLGLRFLRLGYRTGVITHPTYEDAPHDLAAWLPQRARWFKGWTKTWLVHMREPRRLYRELGPASFLAVQVLFLGMLVSALIHPLCIATVLVVSFRLGYAGAVHTQDLAMFFLSLANIAFGYGAFLAIGAATLLAEERGQFWKVVLLTPVHWMLLSLAAWLALWEIWRRPHHWNKTPHPPRRAPAGLRDQRSASEGSPMILSSSSPTASRSRPS